MYNVVWDSELETITLVNVLCVLVKINKNVFLDVMTVRVWALV